MEAGISLHHQLTTVPVHLLGADQRTVRCVMALYIADQAVRAFTTNKDVELDIVPLHPSYHRLVDRPGVEKSLLDSSLLYDVRRSRALMRSYL